MKFTVERDTLHDALGVAARRSKGGPDIPILSHVLITASDNVVSLTGHNLDSCSIVEVTADVAAPGEITIPADRLHKLVGGLSKGSTVIIESGDASATVRCGRASYKFATLPPRDFPAVLQMKEGPEAIDLTAEQVVRLLGVPSPCILQEEARFYLRGICLHTMTGGIVACATNGHTLIRTTVRTERPDFPRVIVPEAAAREIVAVAKDKGAKLCITSNLISAESGGHTYVSKLIDADFPDYSRVIPEATATPMKIDAKDIDASLDRLMTARDPKAQAVVKLAWNKGELTASLRSEFGQGEERHEVDCERDAGEIGAQVEYLRELVEAAGGEVVCFDISDPGSPIRITNPKQDDFVAVCMPCRV